jgi:hypothetical protein
MNRDDADADEEDVNKELDKCSCGRFKYKADAACWICENDAMDAADEKAGR